MAIGIEHCFAMKESESRLGSQCPRIELYERPSLSKNDIMYDMTSDPWLSGEDYQSTTRSIPDTEVVTVGGASGRAEALIMAIGESKP